MALRYVTSRPETTVIVGCPEGEMQTFRTSSRTLSLLLAGALLLCATNIARAGIILDGGSITGSTTEGAVRYRDLGNTNANSDIYLGVGDLGVAANRVEKNYYGGSTTDSLTPIGSWLYGPGVNRLTFTYDKANDRLITNVVSAYSYQLIFDSFSTKRANPTLDLNYLSFGLRGSATGTVTLQNILLDGNAIDSVAANDATYRSFYLAGYDLSNGFTLTADLLLTGTLSKAESSKVDISFGNAPLVPEPYSATLLGTATAIWLLRRGRRISPQRSQRTQRAERGKTEPSIF